MADIAIAMESSQLRGWQLKPAFITSILIIGYDRISIEIRSKSNRPGSILKIIFGINWYFLRFGYANSAITSIALFRNLNEMMN